MLIVLVLFIMIAMFVAHACVVVVVVYILRNATACNDPFSVQKVLCHTSEINLLTLDVCVVVLINLFVVYLLTFV